MARVYKAKIVEDKVIDNPPYLYPTRVCSGRLLGSSWLGGFPLEVTESDGPSFVISKASLHRSFNIKSGYYGPRLYRYGLKKENYFENFDCEFSSGGIFTSLHGSNSATAMNPLIVNNLSPLDFCPLPVFHEERSYSLRLPPHLFGPEDHSDMNVHIANQVRDKIKNASVNLGAQFVTLKETLALFEDCLDVLRTLKRKGVRVDKSIRDALGNGWLTWSYGFKPLISDLYTLVEDVSKGELEIPYSKNTGRSRRHLSLDWNLRHRSSSLHIGYSFSNWYGSYDQPPPGTGSELPVIPVVTRGTYDAGLTCIVTYDIRHTLTQLGITNPATWLWEYIPLSFVLDWAWKIGDMLSRLDALYGVEFRTAYYMERIKLHHACDYGTMNHTYYRRLPVFDADGEDVNVFKDVFNHSFGSVEDYLSLSLGQVEDGTGLELVVFKADGSFNTRLANALALVNGLFL